MGEDAKAALHVRELQNGSCSEQAAFPSRPFVARIDCRVGTGGLKSYRIRDEDGNGLALVRLRGLALAQFLPGIALEKPHADFFAVDTD